MEMLDKGTTFSEYKGMTDRYIRSHDPSCIRGGEYGPYDSRYATKADIGHLERCIDNVHELLRDIRRDVNRGTH